VNNLGVGFHQSLRARSDVLMIYGSSAALGLGKKSGEEVRHAAGVFLEKKNVAN
jgi:hypothetical protein